MFSSAAIAAPPGGVHAASAPDRPITRADVMRATDVADLTGLPVSTVYAYARQGRLPCRRRGRHMLFLRWEIEAWLCAPDPS